MSSGMKVLAVVMCSMLFPHVPGVVFGDAAAEDVYRSDPGRLSFGGRFSESVQEVVADALVPVWTPVDSVVFLNLRGMFLEDEAQEVNAGLVARRLSRAFPLILGFNAYYDGRWTERDNTFHQVGAGVEALTPWVDFRANYYEPLTDAKVLGEFTRTCNACGPATSVLRMRTYEEALAGGDAEIGVWLPYLSRRMPTALFAGYYHFSSDHGDDRKGWRLRFESRVHPNLTFDAEWFEDRDLNRTDYFAGVRVHLPLDFWNGLRFGKADRASRVLPFEARMNDMVNRDFRIRTLETGPVVVGREMGVDVVSPTGPVTPSAAPSYKPPASSAPPTNCYLNDEGDVVCK